MVKALAFLYLDGGFSYGDRINSNMRYNIVEIAKVSDFITPQRIWPIMHLVNILSNEK